MGTHPLIFIRADGNRQIASGHLVRCLSIAQACHSLGMEVRFLVCGGESLRLLEELIKENKCEFLKVTALKTAVYDQPQREIAEVTALLRAHARAGAPNPLSGATRSSDLPGEVTYLREIVYLLDSYYVTEDYLSAIRPLARVAYLDDLQLFDYPVDLLVNYDVIPQDELASYRSAYRNADRLLLGACFAPLRTQFQNRTMPVRKQAENILITTGAGDGGHLCLSLARRFLRDMQDNPTEEPAKYADIRPRPHFGGGPGRRRNPFPTVHMVIGKLNDDRDELCLLAGQIPFLCLHENVSDMAGLMQACDLAVSAAGTTLYELCALGVPTVSFSMADNQIPSARAFDAVGAISWAGDLRRAPLETIQSLINFMTDMSESDSFSERASAHEAMRRLVDGKGAFRIAKALDRLCDGTSEPGPSSK